VPVAAGCDRPLAGELTVAEDIHGASGLDGPDLDGPVAELADVHTVELMRQLLTASADPVTLIATGPLTNVALLLRSHPELRPQVRRIVLMPVVVELTGTHTRGATVVDLHGRSGRPAEVDVAVGLDVDALWRLLMTAVRNTG
jgi:inosine-uridine nucleoside N-ribohydrolase